ncbi:MAG: Gfo/Idh/MocA family oxidoreductase [Planctomycetota bacterium]|nr:Gfo/Idh/MocA family oxidoreductase [Planctomycetota bacterium]
MSKNKYRAAIIGCGWVSTGHMNGYRSTEAVEVTAAADSDKERLAEFSREYGVSGLYTNYRQMLEKEKPDIVSICTWPGLHCEMTVEAAQQSAKAVICEKPMTLSLRQADKMIDACSRAGCQLVVCHQRRLESRYVKAKELLDNGEIGELSKIEVYQCDLFTDDHGVDLLRFYAGDVPVRWVFGQIDWKNRQLSPWGYTTETAAIGRIKFDTELEGQLVAGFAIEGHLSYSVVLKGSKGLIEISGGNYPSASWVALMNDKSHGWKKIEVENRLLGTPRTEMLGKPSIEYFWVESWKRMVESTIDCIENNKEHMLSGRQAAKALEIIAAIYESSRQRSVIHFPLSAEIDRPVELMEKAHSAQLREEGKEFGS